MHVISTARSTITEVIYLTSAVSITTLICVCYLRLLLSRAMTDAESYQVLAQPDGLSYIALHFVISKC